MVTEAEKQKKKKLIQLTILTVIAICSVSGFLYYSITPSKSAKTYAECLDFYNKKKYTDCINCFNGYMEGKRADEIQPDAYLNRGRAYYRTKDWEKAIKDFTRFLKYDDQSFSVYYDRGQAYLKIEKGKEAIADFKKTCMLNKDHKNACELADGLSRGTPIEVAGGGSEEATGVNLDTKELMDAGIKSFKDENYKDALESFTYAIDKDPEQIDAYLYRGMCYRNSGDYEKAIEDYKKVIMKDNNNIEAHNNRGIAYWEQKNYEKALNDYKKALELDKNDPIVHNNMGVLHTSEGRYKEALADYEIAIGFDPNSPEFYWNRGVTYYMMEDIENAKKDFEKACDMGYKKACDEKNNL